jgi:hypothetical protein
MRLSALGLLVLIACGAATTTNAQEAWPCVSTPKRLLRDGSGHAVWLPPDVMRERVTERAKPEGLGMADMGPTQGTIDVLVGTDGNTLCVRVHPKNLHPLLRIALSRAVKKWKFQPYAKDGVRLAYFGRLSFFMCHIFCKGKTGIFVAAFALEP